MKQIRHLFHLFFTVLILNGCSNSGLLSSGQNAKVGHPSVDNILERVQINYSAFQDLQFKVEFTELHNGEVYMKRNSECKMRGPYRTHFEYENGYIAVENCADSPNRESDVFWDVPLWKERMIVSLVGSSNSVYEIELKPKIESGWPRRHLWVDYTRGFVVKSQTRLEDMLTTIEFLKPTEVIPGHWLFTVNRNTLHFDKGDEIVCESVCSNFKANQGLPDSLFEHPKK